MSVQKKIRQKVSNLKEDIRKLRHEFSERFEDVAEEMERRFGRKKAEDEVFRGLPEPSPMTMALDAALRARASQRTFSDEPVDDQTLSNLLFAADGITRKDGRRTTPSAMNWQDTEIYVLKPNGIWRWMPERRGLIFCSPEDLREKSAPGQPLIALAPLHLVYVTNRQKIDTLFTEAAQAVFLRIMKGRWTPDMVEEMKVRASAIHVGAKIEAVHLAAAAMDLACVARTGFNRASLGRALRLRPGESVVACQSLGYRPRSILDHIL